MRIKSIRASCEPDCTVENQAGVFRFEVRSALGQNERCDLLIRQAMNAIDDGRQSAAEGFVAELLQLNPDSVVGHQLAAETAEISRRWDIAEREYRKAVALLAAGRDPRYLWANSREVRGFLERRADRARKASGKR
jgi:Flp pilus assembly protein TadD